MKKLQVKTDSGWAWVFCRDPHRARITTTPNKAQALPQRAEWGNDDLTYFQRHFPAAELRLAATLNP